VGVLGILVAVLVVGLGLTRSALLDVDRVTVSGAQHTPVASIQRATGIRSHSPMTDVDLDRARRGVLALPWIRTVSITRDWPGTVRVVVTERTAVAVVAAGAAGFALVDRDGRVLETSPAAPTGYVVVANVPTPSAPGTTIDPSSGDALAVASSLPPDLHAKVSMIVLDANGVSLRLTEGGVVRLGPATDVDAKLRAADTVLTSVDTKNLCAVDVRVAAAPSLTRGKGCL
jgi:cell division protein FtsQ